VSVWVEGVGDLNRLSVDLGLIGPKSTVKASAVVRKSAADIQATAQAFVPVDTGNLKGSIGSGPVGQDRALRPGDMDAEIGPTAEYGAYVEYGTAHQAPAAYMGPAFDRHAPNFEAALGQVADDLL
jgi:HK97 gp10 family phage protein